MTPDFDWFTHLMCVTHVLQEFLKCTVDLADLLGLHIVMSKFAGKGQLKFMIAGMGWATAELVMTRFVVYMKYTE